MNLAVFLHASFTALGAALAVAGSLIVAGGVVGLIRFPDAYTRVHATNAAHVAGAPVFVLGMAALADNWQVSLRLVLLAMLISAAAPTIGRLTASAAHAAGLTPITGAYRAPRPGARDSNWGQT
jgi:multicomponent Na+:H+ antiporter subunit G